MQHCGTDNAANEPHADCTKDIRLHRHIYPTQLAALLTTKAFTSRVLPWFRALTLVQRFSSYQALERG